MTPDNRLQYRYFFLSFSLSFLLLSVSFFFLANAITPKIPQSVAERRQQAEGNTPGENYLPRKEDALTVLFVGSYTQETGAGTFILVRFDPSDGKIPVTVFPPQTLVDSPTGAETLADVYQYGGAGYARSALSDTIGIPIDRYVRIDAASFVEAAGIIGTVEFDLPYAVIVDGGGTKMTLQKGRQLLDGGKAADIIRSRGYPGGELSRCAVAGDLAAAIINQRIDVTRSVLVDQIFEGVINRIDSDISYADYEGRKQAAQFLARLQADPAVSVRASGAFNAAGTEFTLSDTSIARLRREFF